MCFLCLAVVFIVGLQTIGCLFMHHTVILVCCNSCAVHPRINLKDMLLQDAMTVSLDAYPYDPMSK